MLSTHCTHSVQAAVKAAWQLVPLKKNECSRFIFLLSVHVLMFFKHNSTSSEFSGKGKSQKVVNAGVPIIVKIVAFIFDKGLFFWKELISVKG